jgi:hypothetical protein
LDQPIRVRTTDDAPEHDPPESKDSVHIATVTKDQHVDKPMCVDLTTKHTIEFVEDNTDNDPNDPPFCFQTFIEHQEPVPLRGLVNWDIGVTTYEPLVLDIKGVSSSHKYSITETKPSMRCVDPMHWRGITDNNIPSNSRNTSLKDKVTSRDSSVCKPTKPQVTFTTKDGEIMTSNIKLNVIQSPQYTRLMIQGSHVGTWCLKPPPLWKGETIDPEPLPLTKGRPWYGTPIPEPPQFWPADTPEPEPPPEPLPPPKGSSTIITDLAKIWRIWKLPTKMKSTRKLPRQTPIFKSHYGLGATMSELSGIQSINIKEMVAYYPCGAKNYLDHGSAKNYLDNGGAKNYLDHGGAKIYLDNGGAKNYLDHGGAKNYYTYAPCMILQYTSSTSYINLT